MNTYLLNGNNFIEKRRKNETWNFEKVIKFTFLNHFFTFLNSTPLSFFEKVFSILFNSTVGEAQTPNRKFIQIINTSQKFFLNVLLLYFFRVMIIREFGWFSKAKWSKRNENLDFLGWTKRVSLHSSVRFKPWLKEVWSWARKNFTAVDNAAKP